MPRRTLPWLLLLPLAGCAEGSNPSPAPRVSLYDRLGKKPGLSDLVKKTADQVKGRWSDSPLQGALVEELGAALGGPAVAEKKSGPPLHVLDAEVQPLTEAFERALNGEKTIDAAYRERVLLRFKALLAELAKRPPPAKSEPN